jgi:hypothetical protein
VKRKKVSEGGGTMKFFVMIRHQKGHPMMMVDENEDVQLFTTREDAEDAGKKNLFGETYGYEVYEWQ